MRASLTERIVAEARADVAATSATLAPTAAIAIHDDTTLLTAMRQALGTRG